MSIIPFFEATVPEGLEAITQNELHTRLGGQEQLLHLSERKSGVIQFNYKGKLPALLGLRSVLSLFSGLRFDVPRPRALMGHQNFEILVQLIEAIIKLSPKGSYRTLYLAAAGSETSVMTRFAAEIAARTGLKITREEGDLLVRVRRPLDHQPGWEVLARMTPRPLSTRSWRVCDYEGALNSAVAYAAVALTHPSPQDVFLNVGCGSGTLLIERAASGPARRLIGCDIQAQALADARQNVDASGSAPRIELYPWDACALPLPDRSIDVLCSDLPFGIDVGSHQENVRLYPRLLKEAARVARPAARCVLLTQEIRLMDGLLKAAPDWQIERSIPVLINGLRPRIYVLKRS